MPALSYDDVLNRWDTARAFGETKSLPEYSSYLNNIYGTQDFSAGLRDGPWTRFSARADQVLKSTVGQVTGPIGGAIGSLVGNEEAGQRVGESLPRALLETAPLYLAGPEAGVPATALALGGTGALMGAHTYAETGSPKAATIAGLTGALLPGIGHVGGALGARLAGATKLGGEWLPEAGEELAGKRFSGILPETSADAAQVTRGRILGSQTAQIVANQASMYVIDKSLGQSYNPMSPDFWLNQIPFTVFDAYHGFHTEPRTAQEIRPLLKAPGEAKTQASDYVPPVTRPELQAQMEANLTNLQKVYADPNATEEQKSGALTSLIATTQAPEEVQKVKDVVTPTESPDVSLMGSMAQKLKSGNHKFAVSNWEGPGGDQMPEHKTVFVNSKDVTYDPTTQIYGYKGKLSDIRFNVHYPLRDEDKPFLDAAQNPPLPEQEAPANVLFPDEQRTLQDMDPDWSVAQSPYEEAQNEIDRITDQLESSGVDVYKLANPTDKTGQWLLENASHEWQAMPQELVNAYKLRDEIGGQQLVHSISEIQKALTSVGLQPQELTRVLKVYGLDETRTSASDQYLAHKYVRDQAMGDLTHQAENVAYALGDERKEPFDELKDLPEKTLRDAASMVKIIATYFNHPETDVDFTSLKDSLHEYEQAKASESSARAATSTPLDDAKNISEVVLGPAPGVEKAVEVKEGIEQKLKEGKTPVQAVEETRLKQTTPEVDKALTKQNALKKRVKKQTDKQAEYRESIQKGNLVIAAYEIEAAKDPTGESQASRVIQAIQKALSTPDVQDTKLSERVIRVVAQWTDKQGSIEQLEASLGRTAQTAKLGSSRTVESFLVDGKRIYGDETTLKAYIKEHKLDKEGWRVETRKDGGLKRLFIGRRPQKEVSLNLPVGEGGKTSLQDILKTEAGGVAGEHAEPELVQDPEQYSPPPEELPKVSKNTKVNLAQSILEDPTDFAQDTYYNDQISLEEHTLDTRQKLGTYIEFMKLKETQGVDTPSFLTKLNERLAAKGFEELGSMTDVKSDVLDIDYKLDDYKKTYRSADLGSEVPEDKTFPLNQLIRNGGGIHAWLDWFINNPESKGIGEYAKVLKRFSVNLAGVDFTFPGQPDHDPSWGWSYHEQPGQRSLIQAKYLPSDRQDAFLGGIALVHEVTHHVFSDLLTRQDPAGMELRKTLDTVLAQIRTSKALPKELRKALMSSASEKWYEQFVSGKITAPEFWAKYDKIMGDKGEQWFDIFYGLQNKEELLAQTFSRPEMVRILSETKMPTTLGQTVLQFFKDVMNRILGVPKGDTALEHILTSADNFLDTKQRYDGHDFIRDSLIGQGTRPEALASRKDTVERTFAKGTLNASIKGWEREQANGLLPVSSEIGEVNQVLRTGLLNQDAKFVSEATKGLLADEVPVHQELWNRMQEDVRTARELLGHVREGRIAGTVPPNAELNLFQSQQRLNAMKTALDKQALAIQRLPDLGNFTAEGLQSMVAGQLVGKRLPAPPDPVDRDVHEEAQRLLGLRDDVQPTAIGEARQVAAREKLEGGKGPVGGFIQRTFMLANFMAQQVPAFRKIYSHVFQEQGEAFKRIKELNLVYNSNAKTKELDPEIKKANDRVTTNPALNNAASDLKRFVQVQEQAGTKWTLNDPYVKNLLSSFNQNDRAAILQEFNSEQARREFYVNHVAPLHLTQTNREMTALSIISREIGMLPEQARALADNVYDSLAMLQDPQTAIQGVEGLRILSSKMQPNTYQKSLALSQGLIQSSQAHLDFLRTRPNFVTEQRYGTNHLVMAGPKGEPYRRSFESDKEAASVMRAKETQGWKLLDYVKKTDANVAGGGIDGDVLDSMRQLDMDATNRLQQSLSDLPPEILQRVLPEVQRASDYQASMQAFSPLPGEGGARRKFVAGRENINMVDNANQFYAKTNNWMRHRMVRAQTSVDAMDPEIQGNRALNDYARQHVDNQLAPDNPIARKAVEATYFTKLAWNFGVNMLHGIQSLTTGMASVIAETGGVGDAFELTGKASKAVAQRYTTGKWANPEHEAFVNWMVAHGNAGLATWDLINDPDRNTAYDASVEPGMAGKVVSTLKNAARSWTGVFMKHNDMVGGLAGYELARSRGMSIKDASDFALDMKNKGYYSAGKSQRAVGFWSIKTKAIPQLFSSLNTYSFGWFSQLANNYLNGFGQGPKGLSDTQRVGARKAFLYQLGAQAVLAGALGLPGMGQGVALLKQVTGVDTKSWARKNLATLFDEDKVMGGMMTSLALHGAVASFSPIDPSGRHMISFPFTGVSPYKGFDLSTLAPAPVAAVSDLVQGLFAAAKGDAIGFGKALPHVLQGPYQLWQGEGDVRDDRGGLLYQLSPSERFITALGMSPTRVQNARDTALALKETEAAATRQQADLADQVATTLRKQGPEAARSLLGQIGQTRPDVQLPALARATALRYNAQTIPFDPRRGMNVGADMAGLPVDQAPQEFQRLQQRQSTMQILGFPSRISGPSFSHAQQIDALISSNPLLSPAGARQQVSSRRRPAASQYNDLLSPGLQ